MSSLLTDRRGRLRIGAHSGLYRRARDGGVADFGSAGFLEPGVNRNVVQALLESRDGWIWVGTEHAGLRLLAPDAEPGDAATTRAWVMPTRVSGDRAAPVVQTADDAIWWVGMNGLRSLRKRTRDDWGDAELVLHGLSSGLTTLVHEWVTEDQVGDLWIAGDGSGALRVTRRGFTTFTEADGLDSRAVHASTAASDGAVVAVTERMRHSWYRTPAPASVSSSPAARRACALPASIDSRRRGIGGPRNAFAMDAAGLRGSASSRVPRRTRRARPWATPGPVRGAASCGAAPGALMAAGLPGRPARGGRPRHGMFMRPARAGSFPRGGARSIVQAPRTLMTPGHRRCARSSWGLAVLLALACGAHPQAERLPLQNFTMRDGLPSDSVLCLVGDRAGFLWICTTEGLSVYDGFTFRTFGTADGLPHSRVTRVLHARDGTYWIGTEDGLARFRPSRRPGGPRFTVVRPPAPAHWFPDAVITNRVLSLLEDRSGRVWCGFAQAGLFTVDETAEDIRLVPALPELPIDTQVNALAEAQNGTMWIGTNRGLLRRQPNGPDQWFGHREGIALASGAMHEDIGSLLLVGSRLFVGTRLAGLYEIDPDASPGQRAVIRSWRSQTTHGGDTVNSLTMTSDGHLWYSGPGGAREVTLDAEAPDTPRIWGVREGLAPSTVEAVAEDAAGNIWIGTDGAGVFRLRRGGFRTYTVEDGLAGDEVKDLLVAQGTLHVVTANERGLFLNRFADGRFTAAPRPYYVDPLAWGTNQLILRDRVGDWWYATWTGVVRSAARSMEAVGASPVRRYGASDGAWSNQAFKLFEDSRGDVWIGTYDQLHNVSRWRRETGRIERHEVRTFPYGIGFGFGFVPLSFAEATGGAIWVGSAYGGLSRFKDERWTFFDEQRGAPAGRIQSLLRDRRGRLWIGSTSGGLARVDRPDEDQPVFVPIRKADGLSSDAVLALTEDLDGFIYVGTGLGVDRLDPETFEVRRYGVEDGLPGGPVVSAIRDPMGDLWFGTRQGLSRFTPSTFEDSDWPELRVMRVSAPDLDVGLADLGEREVPDLELQPHQNAVQIAVGVLAAGPMPGVRFEGRLEGTGAEWVPVEPGRPVMLLNLQPGAYRFVARAVTASGRSGPSSVSVAFTILRPWYQRPWAVVLEALVLLGFAAGAYNVRVRHLLALERVRSRIASDLHDDIGTSLSRVALISEAARGHRGSDREAVALGALGEVATTARSLASDVADLAWASDPHDDTLANVIGRASWFGSELFVIRGTEWRCTVDESAAARRLGPEDKRHLLLLLKEALNNIAKHADARAASLEALAVEGQLVITIVDDGRGFDAATAPRSDGNGNGNGGRGLSNLASRARALGGTCDVSSSPGAGCRITIRLP